jgi:hypothetical protein
MTSLIYNEGKKQILDGSIDLLNDILRVALVTSSYTPDKDAHVDFGDIDNEVSGAGYITADDPTYGKELSNPSVKKNITNDRAEFNAEDVIWTTATITARAAIIFKFVNDENNDTNILIAYIDFGKDYSASSEDFTIEWDSEGILYLGE